MQLSLVFAILAALLSGNMAPTAPLPDVLQRLLLCGLLLTLVAMVGRMVAGATVIGLHGMGGVPSLWPARFRRLRAVHTLTWVAAAAAIYFGLGWPQIVRENWGLKGTVLLDEILILLPLLLLLLFSWWTLGTAYDALAERAAVRNWVV
jgi:hypothetical protein